jgi:O-succinylbenzoate synthase
MRIKHIRVLEFDLTLTAPIVTSRGAITSRRGLLLAIQEQNDAVGFGEISPLPDFGTEDWSEASAIIEKLEKRRDYPQCGHTIEEIAIWRERVGIFHSKTPAAAFGVECALLSLAAQLEDHNPMDLLSMNSVEQIQVNAFIGGGEPDEIAGKVAEAVRAGYPIVKIKSGVHSLREDLETLQLLHERHPKLRVRLDANGAWSVEGTIAFLTAAAKLPLDYVEDPVPADKLAELLSTAPPEILRIGLDETADHMAALFDEFKVIKKGANVAVIVKPTRFGSFSSLRDYTSIARSRGASVIITSMFESSLGLSYQAICAAAFGSARMAHGLGTASALSQDTLEKSFMAVKGQLTIPDVRSLVWRVRPELITQLDLENIA